MKDVEDLVVLLENFPEVLRAKTISLEVSARLKAAPYAPRIERGYPAAELDHFVATMPREGIEAFVESGSIGFGYVEFGGGRDHCTIELLVHGYSQAFRMRFDH